MPDTEQIKSLIRRKFAGELSTEESSLLSELLASNPELEALQNQLHEEYSSLTAQTNLAELRENFDTIKERAIEERKRILEEKKTGSLWVWRISTAAAALLLFVGGLFWMQSTRIDKNPEISDRSGSKVSLVLPTGEEVDLSDSVKKQLGNVTLSSNNQKLTYSLGTDGTKGTATLHVPDGKDFSVQLSDGTEIQLNSGSTLSFPFSFPKNSREVTISGEAFLKVARNPKKPFLVRIKNHGSQDKDLPTVQVLGTEFNVNSYNSLEIRVSLVEGSVKMTTVRDSIRLKPGQQALVQPGKKLQTELFDAGDVLSWRTGVLEFKGTPLQEVFDAMPRWYGVEISIDDPSLKQRIFTGAMDRKKTINSFLQDLQFTHGIESYYKEGTIHLTLMKK